MNRLSIPYEESKKKIKSLEKTCVNILNIFDNNDIDEALDVFKNLSVTFINFLEYKFPVTESSPLVK